MQLEFNGFTWLIGMAILTVLLFVLRRRGIFYLLFFSIFWVYLLVLVSVTVFPIPLGMGGGFKFETIWAQIVSMFKFSGLNLIPLYFGNCWDLPRACAIGIYENILMTVPFGFGINFIARLRKRDFIWLAFAVGLVIEATQFALDLLLGGVYRTVDVNDVLFNALGVWIGVGLFFGFARLFMAITKRFEIRHTGLLAYIQIVASQVGFVGTARPMRASSTIELDQ
jgi:glycopeptide antibiotics resistance protein